jgi:hypothetical protein
MNTLWRRIHLKHSSVILLNQIQVQFSRGTFTCLSSITCVSFPPTIHCLSIQATEWLSLPQTRLKNHVNHEPDLEQCHFLALKHNLLQCTVWIEVLCSMHKTNEDQHCNWNLKIVLRTVMTRASCKCYGSNISYTHLKRLGLSGSQKFIWHERRPQCKLPHHKAWSKMWLSKVRHVNKGAVVLRWVYYPGGIKKINWDMGSH